RDVFNRAVEFAAAIGCGHITGLPGVFHPDVDRTRDFDLAAEEAAWRVETARRGGLVYSVEPHMGSICPTPEAASRLLDRAAGLTLTLDYGHFIAAGIANADVHRLVPYTSHVHVRGGCPGKLQAAVEDNTIDFAGLVERLKIAQYSGFLCLEYVWIDWQGCNRTDNISETLLLRRALESMESR
ncbi:MAG: sugar phosphate isomerase/epimerase family protein, partial [Bryobacteraceae bacterium]